MSELILTPLSESSPCGKDFKYEDAFLNIENEIDKTNSMIEDVHTDWAKVTSEALELLEKDTKDTKVFCWWMYGSWKKESWKGLEKALIIFNELLVKYEDKLFPTSVKVKISSINWLENILNEEMLDERGVLSVSIDAKVFLSLFEELEKNFALTTKSEQSIFTKLKRELARVAKEKEDKEKSSQSSTQNSSPVSSSGELNEINSDADAITLMRSFKKQASLLQKYYRKNDASDLRAIRLVRMLSWIDTEGLPMNDGGKTPLSPASQIIIDEIEEFISQEKYTEALDKTENLIASSPFWLDGHLTAFNILNTMGHSAAATQVQTAFVSYISIDKDILNLTFKDTTPFASVKLKKWISEITQTSASVSTDEESMEDDKEQIIEKCYALAKKKQIKEAMKLLQDHHSSAVNQEDKFNWRLAKAELAAEFGKTEIALALLEDLKKDIDKYNLDEWKPELAARVFSLFLSFKRTHVDAEHLNAAYTRLCKIDIEQALEIKL